MKKIWVAETAQPSNEKAFRNVSCQMPTGWASSCANQEAKALYPFRVQRLNNWKYNLKEGKSMGDLIEEKFLGV